MRKGLKITFWIILLAAIATVVIVRWQAWFGTPEEPMWTGDTIVYTIPSLPAENAEDALLYELNGELNILVLGDIHNGLTRDNYDTLAARVPQVDLIAQTGDWLERGQFYYLQAMLHEWVPSALSNVPVVACPGNHEYSKGLLKTVSPVWTQTFTHPHNGPEEVPGEHFYVDLPNLRFIIIDTNPLIRLPYLTRTLTWLRETMDQADGRKVVVMMHHPVLSPAKGRFNPLIYAAFRNALGEADLVIAGHDHSYMRCAPFVVVNAAGKPKQQRTNLHAEVTDSIPVYSVLTVTQPAHSQPAELFFKTYRLSDGLMIDSLYAGHH